MVDTHLIAEKMHKKMHLCCNQVRKCVLSPIQKFQWR